MKRTLSILVTLMLVLSMVPTAFAAEDITIAAIGQQLGNVVFLGAEKGAKAAGEDLGINVIWQSPLRAEAELQNEIMNNLIDMSVNGIAISCTTGDALKDVIDRAIASGIQVSCYDVDSPDSKRAFYAGTENYKAGYTCGEYMIELFKDSGLEKVRVAQLEGIPGANDIEARKLGFADAIKGSNIEVVYSFACDDDVDKAVEGVEAYTRAEGANIDAWYMSGGWPYTVAPTAMPETNAWKLADPNHKVVTVDIFVETTPAFFEMGVLDIAVGQNFFEMGYQSVVNLYKLIKGETIDAPYNEDIGGNFINTGVQVATASDWKEVIG
ncbi:MAG: substrate-binding domain-containing protein [Clostridia bacterium]